MGWGEGSWGGGNQNIFSHTYYRFLFCDVEELRLKPVLGFDNEYVVTLYLSCAGAGV